MAETSSDARASILMVLTTETPETVELPNLAALVQQAMSSEGSIAQRPSSPTSPSAPTGTPAEAEQGLVSVAKLNPADYPDAAGVDFGAAVRQSLPADDNITVVACNTSAAVEWWLMDPTVFVSSVITVNATEALPVAQVFAAAAPTKGKKEVKKDPKKAKGKDAQPEEEKKVPKLAEDIAGWPVDVEKSAPFRNAAHMVNLINVQVATAANVEATLISDVIPEIKDTIATLADYREWRNSQSVRSVAHASATTDVRTASVAAKTSEDGVDGVWSIGAALGGMLHQAALNRATAAAPRLVQKIDAEALQESMAAYHRRLDEAEQRRQSVMRQDSERRVSTANSQVLTPTSARDNTAAIDPPPVPPARGALREVYDRPDLTDGRNPDDAAAIADEATWAVQQHIKAALGMPSEYTPATPRVQSRGASLKEPLMPALVPRNLVSELTAAFVSQLPINDQDNNLRMADLLRPLTEGAGYADPAEEAAMLRAVERNMTPRELDFILLQSMLQRIMQTEFPHLAGAPIEDYVYLEQVTQAEMSEAIARYALLSPYSCRIHSVPWAPVSQQAASMLDTNAPANDVTVVDSKSPLLSTKAIEAGATCGLTMVAADVPPTVKGLNTGRRRASVTTLPLSGLPTLRDYLKWSGSGWVGPENRWGELMLADDKWPFYARKGIASRRDLIEELVEEVHPYDGSVVWMSSTAGTKRVTVSRDDVCCGLRSTANATGTKRYFTATFDDGVVFTGTVEGPLGLLVDDAAATVMDVAVAGEALTTQIDEQKGDVVFTHRTWRQKSFAAFCPVSRKVVQLTDTETSRRISNETGAVYSFMASGAVVVMYPDGKVSVTTKSPDGSQFVMITFPDGRRVLRSSVMPTPVPSIVPSAQTTARAALDSARSVSDVGSQQGGLNTHRSSQGGGSARPSRVQSLKKPRGSSVAKVAPSATPIEPDTPPLAPSPPVVREPKVSWSELPRVEFKAAEDAENDCLIDSRGDGMLTIRYRPAAEDGSAGSDSVHTRVVVHADGTQIVSFLTPLTFSSSPMLSPMTATERAFVADAGTRKFFIESPDAPKVFLLSPKGFMPTCTTALHAVVVQFGDGSLLKRHAPLQDSRYHDSSYLETVFSRVSETTVRINHNRCIAFVEPHSVQLSAKTPVNIAIGEGVWTFDYFHGCLRIVDIERCQLDVKGCTADPDVEPNTLQVFDFEWTAQSDETLLVGMAPQGFTPHAIPKRVLEAREKAAAEASKANANSKAPPLFPSVEERLRDMVNQYVVENNLLGPRRGRAAEGTLNKSVKLPTSQADPAASMKLLRGSDDTATRRALDRDRRPLMFIERSDGTALRVMCSNDLIGYVHRKATQKEALVSRSQFSGEPGIQQITFSDLGNGGRKVMNAATQRSILFATGAPAGSTRLFDGTLEPGRLDGTSWLPRSVMPMRRTKHQRRPDGSDEAPAHATAERVVLRHAPCTDAVRRLLIRKTLRLLERNQRMDAYAETITRVDGRTADERAAETLLMSRNIQTLTHFKQAMAATNYSVDEVCNVSPPRGNVEQEGTTMVLDLNAPPADQPAPELTPTSTMQRSTVKKPASVLSNAVVVETQPQTVNFHSLPAGFRFSSTLSLTNLTTNAIFFSVRCAKQRGSVVSVQSGKGIVSPKGTATVVLVAAAHVRGSVASGESIPFRETLLIECQGTKRILEVPVTGSIVSSDNTFAVDRSVRILGSV